MGRKRELWECPRCHARFTTRNQRHSCGTFSLDALFRGSLPQVRRLYECFVEIVRACGPVTVIPQKTRIAFQVRMRFAALTPSKTCLRGHLVLARRRPSRCFDDIESFSPRNHVHRFRLESEIQLDETFRRFVQEAYEVGRQEHIHPDGG